MKVAGYYVVYRLNTTHMSNEIANIFRFLSLVWGEAESYYLDNFIPIFITTPISKTYPH